MSTLSHVSPEGGSGGREVASVIWIAYNGWMGEGAVGVIVEASDEEEARVIAVAALRREAPHETDSYYRISICEPIALPYVAEFS